MNRNGFTAIFDAMLFVMLIGFASVEIQNICDTEQEKTEIEQPREVIENIMNSNLRYGDIGIEIEDTFVHPMNRIAYLSLKIGDGKFIEYCKNIIESIYPWENSYFLSVTWSEGTETIGDNNGNLWQEGVFECQDGYGGKLGINLKIFD